MPEPSFEELIEAMRDAVAVLQDAEIPFVLGGGLSAWARGGPRSEHDVDFLVRPDDADQAQQVLADAGMRTEKPPEGWLLEPDDGSVLELARSLREQVDWDEVRTRTADAPFAKAFFTLLDELEIVRD